MKKFLSLLFILPLLAVGVSSCHDDDDTPDVSMSISISNAKNIDGQIYLVSGDTLYIDSVNIKNNEEGKSALISSATYYWNGFRLGTSILYPYGFAIATTKYQINNQGVATGTKPGQYLLAIEAPVAAEDKSLGLAVLTYVVNVVSDPADIPSGPSSQEAPTIPTYK